MFIYIGFSKKSFFCFFATLPVIDLNNKIDNLKLESILKNNKYMTSVKERLVWFVNLIKFEDIYLSDLENFEINKENL